MLDSMQLVSVNVGQVTSIVHGKKAIRTGICKMPVQGPVRVGELGIQDDVIVDMQEHGGADQAIYAYSSDDYDWWREETNREYVPGTFGENLTIRGMPSDMIIGDRLLIGEVVFEATAPRIPCSTLATRMQDTGFGLAFRKAERPGIYFRVLNAGLISAGDAVTYIASEASSVSVLELFRSHYALRHDAVQLQRFLDVPIAVRFRDAILARLEKTTNEQD